MASKVDVLAVMDAGRDALLFANCDPTEIHLHDEARKSVAALIAAASDMENVAGIRGDQLQRFANLRAALASVTP